MNNHSINNEWDLILNESPNISPTSSSNASKYQFDNGWYDSCYDKDYWCDKSLNSFTNSNYIVQLYEWVIHIDQYGLEYIIGCKSPNSKRLWETSTIKEKIVLTDSILIITENESFYRINYKDKL